MNTFKHSDMGLVMCKGRVDGNCKLVRCSHGVRHKRSESCQFWLLRCNSGEVNYPVPCIEKGE